MHLDPDIEAAVAPEANAPVLRSLPLALQEVVPDHADQPEVVAGQSGNRSAHQLVGSPLAVDVGCDNGADPLVGPQQGDQPLVGDRLAEVHEAPATPGAERGVSQVGHDPKRTHSAAGRVVGTWG